MDQPGEASNSFSNNDACPEHATSGIRKPLWRSNRKLQVPSSECRVGNTQNSELRTRNSEHFRARYIHRGSALHSLLMFICGAVLLGTAAVILDPQSLQAGSKPPENFQGAQERRTEFAQTLAGLICDCTDVLAIHERSDTPCVDIVLWVNDDLNPGVIDPHEIAIISQSQLFRTITVYSVEGPGDRFQRKSEKYRVSSNEHRAPRPLGTRNSELETRYSLGTRNSELGIFQTLDRATVSTPQFCDRWRAQPSVVPQVIATGISDMKLERMPASEGQLSALRLSLRWGTDSADGAGEASAVIQAQKFQVPSTE